MTNTQKREQYTDSQGQKWNNRELMEAQETSRKRGPWHKPGSYRARMKAAEDGPRSSRPGGRR